jgi:GNAT superfamily N-acetyltransferase
MREMQEADPWEEAFEEERVRSDLRTLLENSDFGVALIAWDEEQAEKRRPFEAQGKQAAATFANQTEAVGYLVICFDYSLEYRGKGAWVDELFVAAEHRGKGIGTQLLDLAETASRENGAQFLHLEVSHGNRAVELYRRRGFVDHQRFLMTKRLVP